MIQLDRTDLHKTDKSKQCRICHYNYFKNGFKSDSKTCNRCDWGIKSFGTIHLNGFGYRFFMFDMTKEDVIEFIKHFEPNDEFETIDINKISLSRKWMICHYWYFKGLDLYFKPYFCNKCHGRCIFLLLNIEDAGLRCILWGVSKKEAVSILNNSRLDSRDIF